MVIFRSNKFKGMVNKWEIINYKLNFLLTSMYISLQDEKLRFKNFITVHNGKARSIC